MVYYVDTGNNRDHPSSGVGGEAPWANESGDTWIASGGLPWAFFPFQLNMTWDGESTLDTPEHWIQTGSQGGPMGIYGYAWDRFDSQSQRFYDGGNPTFAVNAQAIPTSLDNLIDLNQSVSYRLRMLFEANL
jgi:hypothetical protein